MNSLRKRLARTLLRWAMRLDDSPLRAIYVMNKRTVGDKLKVFTDTEPRVQLSRRKLKAIHGNYLKQQSALLRLYKGDNHE